MSIHDYIEGMLDELRTALSVVNEAQAEKLATAIIEAQAVFVAGAGRSGLAMRSFAMRLVHLGLHAYVVGETTTPRITDRDLLIIGSGSGSTPGLIVHAETARSIGAPLGVITIDEESALAINADLVLTISAPSSKMARDTGARSIQPLASLFEQGLLLTLDAMVLVLMDRTGESSEKMFARHSILE